MGFEDPTSLETNLLSGLTPRKKVLCAHQEGRGSGSALRAPLPTPALRLHHLRRPGEQGPFCPLRPGRARAPLGSSLPSKPYVRPASRWVPCSVAYRHPLQPARAASRPAHGLGCPHLQPEGLSPFRQSNAEGLLQTNAVRACAASLSPRRLRAPTRPSRARRLRRSVAPESRAADLSAERNSWSEPNCLAPCARVRERARRAGGRSGS